MSVIYHMMLGGMRVTSAAAWLHEARIPPPCGRCGRRRGSGTGAVMALRAVSAYSNAAPRCGGATASRPRSMICAAPPPRPAPLPRSCLLRYRCRPCVSLSCLAFSCSSQSPCVLLSAFQRALFPCHICMNAACGCSKIPSVQARLLSGGSGLIHDTILHKPVQAACPFSSDAFV